MYQEQIGFSAGLGATTQKDQRKKKDRKKKYLEPQIICEEQIGWLEVTVYYGRCAVVEVAYSPRQICLIH
jgi:hypothetical protein